MSIYNHTKKLQAAERNIRNGKFSTINKELILKFENSLFAEGLSKVRVIKYLSQLNVISGMMQIDYPEATKDDLQALVAEIVKSDRSDWTKQDYKVTIKRFFRWLNGGRDPVTTEWIKLKINQKSKLPEELLTESEIMRMIEVSEYVRDKALIAVLYDSGARTSEIANLKRKHIIFDQYGAVITVDGKTGMRRVRLIFSVPYLAAWLDVHPRKDNPDSYIWIALGKRNRGTQMMYAAIRMMIKRTALKAGIQKRVYNHLFRHSRSTELAQHLTQAQMEEHLGWVHGSDMPRTYIHMSGKQVDDALLKIHGIVKDEDTMPELTSAACERCGTVNGPTSKFCSRCGMAMSVIDAVNVDEERDKIATEFMELLTSNPAILKTLKQM